MKKIYSALTLWLFTSLAYAQPHKVENLPIREQFWNFVSQYSNLLLSNLGVITAFGLIFAVIACIAGKAINSVLYLEDNIYKV